jgi:hypothetical protein
MKVRMKMQISSGAAADTYPVRRRIVHALVGRSSSGTVQGLVERSEVLVLWI